MTCQTTKVPPEIPSPHQKSKAPSHDVALCMGILMEHTIRQDVSNKPYVTSRKQNHHALAIFELTKASLPYIMSISMKALSEEPGAQSSVKYIGWNMQLVMTTYVVTALLAVCSLT